jgi:hypothetical protein
MNTIYFFREPATSVQNSFSDEAEGSVDLEISGLSEILNSLQEKEVIVVNLYSQLY